jgi:hypothetical protein
MALSLLLLLAPLLLTSFTAADKDPNVYSFGTNPNVRSRNYWADSINVIQDLDQFSALYIKSHGCVWSPNAANFDDDGENRDGDENWYQGRTAEGAANVGFALYGLQKGSLSLRGCSKATYINSFFTTAGVDALVAALGLSTGDDSSGAYCSSYYGNNNNNNNNRQLGSESGDNNNQGQSSTLGCTSDGSFATAVFNGDYCQGLYFVNTTSDGTYDSYNRLSSNKMDCTRIWNGNSKTTDSGYNSMAEEVLSNAQACYLEMDPYCPDPNGMKSEYTKYFSMAESGRSVVFQSRYQGPLKILSYLALLVGLALASFAYFIRNQDRIRSKGGSKIKGFALCATEDGAEEAFKACKGGAKLVRRLIRTSTKKRKTKRKKSRRQRRSSRSNKEQQEDASDRSEIELPEKQQDSDFI